MIARRVRVTGRVQGVFFRAWTQQQALEFGVSGWVRNCPDGSVQAQLEGEQGAVEKLIGRMREGPSDARVDDLESSEAELQGLSSFDVRR